MSTQQITPEDALERIESDGYTYLDVRTVPEFEAGHPRGAYNVPLAHAAPGGMRPNPDFLAVVQAKFPKDTKLIVACKLGGRSIKAAAALEAAGYTDLLDMTAGYDGKRDAFGALVTPGWAPSGLPVETDASPGHSWAELASAAGVGNK